MRIMFLSNIFSPHVIGGYELGCLGLARATQKAGHQVSVLTSLATGRLRKRASASDLDVRPVFSPIYNYETVLSGVPHSVDPASFGGIVPANAIALQNQIRSFEPDAIWVHNPLGLGPVGILETAAHSGVSTVLHLNDHLDETVADHQIGFNVLSRWVRAKQRIGAIACSQKTLERNEIHGAFDRSIVVPNGIPFRGRGQPPRAIPDTQINLIYFGQVESHKGVLQLVQSVAALRERLDTDFRLHIAGSGSKAFAKQIEEEIRHYGLEKLVVIHGFLEKFALQELLDCMHLAVFALSPDEPFAFVVIEAIQAGLATVVTRQAGVAEFLPADYPYFIMNRDDPHHIAEVVEKLLNNRKDAQAWCGEMQTAVVENCDINRSCMPRCVDFLFGTLANYEMTQVTNFGCDASNPGSSVQDGLSSWYASLHLERCLSLERSDRGSAPTVDSSSIGKSLERWVRSQIRDPLRRAIRQRTVFGTRKNVA